MTAAALSWVNKLYSEIKDRLFFRAEDSVLIIPPNRVYKLNGGGIRLLSHLSEGKGIETFPGLSGEKRIRETELFFTGIRDLFAGSFRGEYDGANPVFEAVPYGFDYTRLPVLAELAVTYRCNNNCSFCYLPETADRKRELTTRECKRIIDIFAEQAKVPFFSFTGGEPLLRRDIEKLTEYAAAKGLTVNLVSNGTLCTASRASSLRKAGLGSAQISIEAADAGLHDRLTGRPGAYRESLRGIEQLQNAGIPVQTNTTVSEQNKEAVLALPRFLRSVGIRRFAANLFIPSGIGRKNASLFLSYTDAVPYIRQLHDEAERCGLTFFWYSPTPYCIYNPLAEGIGNKSCAAADGLLSVSPAGDILPCSSYNEAIGNLLSEDFGDIWFSGRAAYFKHKHFAPKECPGCGSFHACQGACPLYWDFAGTEELHGKGGHHARAAG